MSDKSEGDGGSPTTNADTPPENEGNGAWPEERGTDTPPGNEGDDRYAGQHGQRQAGSTSNGHRLNGHHRKPNLFARLVAWPDAREQRTGDYSAYVPVKERVGLLAFAAVTGALLLAVLRFAVGFGWPAAAAFGLGAFVCTALTNWILTSGLTRPRNVVDFLPVVVSSMVLGSVLAVVVIPYVFEADVATLRFSAVNDLEQEVTLLAGEIENPPRPNIDDDPTVSPHIRTYNEAKDRFEKADDAVLCELDGSCGTGRSGRGPVSGRRQKQVDRLRLEVENAEKDLRDARSTAQDRSDKAEKQKTAEKQLVLDDRRDKLTRLRKERAAVESGATELNLGTHMQALPELFARRPAMVPTTFLAIVVAYMLMHLAPLSFPAHAARERRRALDRATAAARQSLPQQTGGRS